MAGDLMSELWADGEGPNGEELDVVRGRGPWRPWHFVGQYTVAPGKIRPQLLHKLEKADRKVRTMVIHQMTAVYVSSAAINRMMDHPENEGLEV